MFQDFALFPHKNVFENVAFGLQMEHRKADYLRARVEETSGAGWSAWLWQRDVNTLSGGEAQRVALARALAPAPRLLMLDEPLGSVDRTLRERLVLDLRHILRGSRQTALYVTHDQEEAFVVADRVALMNHGEIIQIGSPQEIYRNPKSLFTAKFLGLINLLDGYIESDSGEKILVRTPLGVFPLSADAQRHNQQTTPRMGPVTVLLRPDAVQIDELLPFQIDGIVSDLSFRGGQVLAALQFGQIRLEFQFPAYVDLPALGERIQLGFRPDEAIQIFPPASRD